MMITSPVDKVWPTQSISWCDSIATLYGELAESLDDARMHFEREEYDRCESAVEGAVAHLSEFLAILEEDRDRYLDESEKLLDPLLDELESLQIDITHTNFDLKQNDTEKQRVAQELGVCVKKTTDASKEYRSRVDGLEKNRPLFEDTDWYEFEFGVKASADFN